MVSKKEAINASAISAVIVGTVHYFAHQIAPKYMPDNQVMFVGVVVVAATFLMAYIGMLGFKKAF